MRSLPFHAMALAVAVALPVSARAEAEMCMVIPASGVAFDAFDTEMPVVLDVVAPTPVPPLAPEGVILWCANDSDPRCSPVRNEDRPQREWTQGPLSSGGPKHADVARASATSVMFLSNGMAPSSGVRPRIERPPRA